MKRSLGATFAGCTLALLGSWLLAGCTEVVELRTQQREAGADAAPQSPDARAGDDATTGTRTPADPGRSPFDTDEEGRVRCGGRPCSCDNGVDDDGDGHVDGDDAECTGAYDDDEASFATGIPGDNKDECQDCFFDGNSGQGDDGCARPSACLYGELAPGTATSACSSCEVSAQCQGFCLERTPNGCDCFGCCEVQTSAGKKAHVLLADSCTLDAVDDADACPPCVPSTDCRNDCGRCELCAGKEVEDLPEDCEGRPACGGGTTPCDSDDPCPSGFYCQLGCCLLSVI